MLHIGAKAAKETIMSGETETAAGQDAEGSEKKPESGLTKKIVAGAAIGIGSAALVAALLYANRSTRSKRARKG